MLAALPAAVGLWARRWSRQQTRWATLDYLAFLAARGLPLRGGLEVLEREWGGTRGREVAQIRQRLQDTGSLAEALAERPGLFPGPLRELLRASERTGALPATLAVAARELDPAHSSLREPERVLYPVGLLAVSICGAAFSGELIHPKLGAITEHLSAAPPLDPMGPTFQLVLGGVLVALLLLLLSQCEGAPRRLVLTLARGVPLLRGVLLQRGRARSLRQAGALLGVGVPLPEALDAAAALEGAVPLGDAAALAARGAPLADVVRLALGPGAETLHPRVMLLVDAVGPAAGLARAAELLDERTSRRRAWAVAIVEPLPVLAAGALVLSLCLSMFGFLSRVHEAILAAIQETW